MTSNEKIEGTYEHEQDKEKQEKENEKQEQEKGKGNKKQENEEQVEKIEKQEQEQENEKQEQENEKQEQVKENEKQEKENENEKQEKENENENSFNYGDNFIQKSDLTKQMTIAELHRKSTRHDRNEIRALCEFKEVLNDPSRNRNNEQLLTEFHKILKTNDINLLTIIKLLRESDILTSNEKIEGTYKAKIIKGDGNCLFHSISTALSHGEKYSNLLRLIAIHTSLINVDLFYDHIWTDPFYYDQMRAISTVSWSGGTNYNGWGDTQVVMAIAIGLRRRIVVISQYGNQPFNCKAFTEKPPITIECVSNHYQTLVFDSVLKAENHFQLLDKNNIDFLEIRTNTFDWILKDPEENLMNVDEDKKMEVDEEPPIEDKKMEVDEEPPLKKKK